MEDCGDTYDRAVVQYKLSSSKLNFPDGLPIDDEEDESNTKDGAVQKVHVQNI
jgi:hypothetical protein